MRSKGSKHVSVLGFPQTQHLSGEEVDARDAFKLLRRVMLPPQWLPEGSEPLEVSAVKSAKVRMRSRVSNGKWSHRRKPTDLIRTLYTCRQDAIDKSPMSANSALSDTNSQIVRLLCYRAWRSACSSPRARASSSCAAAAS
jgi:hypothetical protein